MSNTTSAYILTANGVARTITPKNGTDFQLEEAQGYVDGYIEVIHLTDEMIMILNEEGKFSKPANFPATVLAVESRAIRASDYICGDVIVCSSGMLK